MLTGKMSDFAGLFFFPYLMIGLMAAGSLAIRQISAPRRIAERISISTVAYVGTALVFLLLKLHPGAAAGTSSFLSHLFGVPIYIASDPTDLVALLALWPSRQLWNSVARARDRRLGAGSILAVGFAALAAVATSPCLEPLTVTHLIQGDSRIYAVLSDYGRVEILGSTDYGESWDFVDPEQVPASVSGLSESPVSLPKIECVPRLQNVCYRVAGHEQVETSTDGGQTWDTVWSIPASRRSYMERVAEQQGLFLACGKELDARTFDLTILGEGDQHLVLVAAGNEGVLRGKLGRQWEQFRVGSAQPTPSRGELEDAFLPSLVFWEMLVALGAGALAFILLSFRSEFLLTRASDPPLEIPPPSTPTIVAWSFLGAIAILIILATFGIYLVPAFILVAIVSYFGRRWRHVAKHSRRGGRVFRASALGGLMVLILGWLPFALWVLGVIPGYSAALLLAMFSAGAAFAWSLWRIQQAGCWANSQELRLPRGST